MRWIPFLLAISLSSAGPAINEIYANPLEGETEFLELYNPGDATELTNWTLSDAAGNTFTFPEMTLDTGAYLTVGGDLPWTTVWNNGGDTAILRNATGHIVDQWMFGATAKGESIYAGNQTGEPTPGYGEEITGGELQLTVQNVAPDLWIEGPTRIKAGEAAQFSWSVDDANGDLASWSIQAPETLAFGTEPSADKATFIAPATPGPWHVQIQAEDETGQTNTALFVATVALSNLYLNLQGPLSFNDLTPGQTNIETGTFQVTNQASEEARPLLEIADFQGPTNFTAQTLEIWWGAWIPYRGGIMELPAIQPGETMETKFRISEVPRLPAGDYGTSFTVTE